MKRTARRAIFYFLIAVFIVATPLVVLYAIGYGVDLTGRGLTRTGGFFVKTNATGITVLVDNEPKSETNFLSRGALVTGLTPGLYSVKIEKEGFSSWRKSVEITEQVIQEFRSIILVPDMLPASLLWQAGTSSASSTPRLILPNSENTHILFVTEDERKETLRVIARGSGEAYTIPFSEPQMLDSARWSNDNQRLLIGTKENSASHWSIFSVDTRRFVPLTATRTIPVILPNATTSQSSLLTSGLKDVRWSPRSTDELYVLHTNNLYRWSRRDNQAEKILEHVHSFDVVGERILFVNEGGFLAESNLSGGEIQTLDRPGFFMADAPFVFIRSQSGIRMVIDSAGGLYVENTVLRRFLPIEGNSRAKVSPEDTMLAFSSGSTLATIMLESETRQPFRKRYERRRVIDAVVPVKDFIWFGDDASHFVFTTNGGVFLTEEDARFGANTITLQTGLAVIAEVPGSRNRLYIASEKRLEEITIKQ